MTDTAAPNRFEDLQLTWEGLAQSDPLWAILSDPKRKDGKWDIAEFFQTGEQEIAVVESSLSAIGRSFPATGPALDFGCGVGRLTQAIGRRMAPAIGVDIAKGMIDGANRLNRQGDRCRFVHNAEPTLPFPDSHFTLIYSSVVLQHIPRPFADRYIAEFVRVLQPGHLAIFQTFDAWKGPPPRTWAQRWQAIKAKIGLRTKLRRLLGHGADATTGDFAKPGHYSMNAFPETEVRAVVEKAGGKIADVKYTNSTDADFNGALAYLPREPAYGYVSKQFIVTK